MENRYNNQIIKFSSIKLEDIVDLKGILEIEKLSRLLEQFYRMKRDLMKIKGWHLIVLAIIVFFLYFFTLGNRQVIDNQIANQIAVVIAVLSVLLFLIGVVKTLHDLLSKNKGGKKNEYKYKYKKKSYSCIQ